jgi:hypothetical protein
MKMRKGFLLSSSPTKKCKQKDRQPNEQVAKKAGASSTLLDWENEGVMNHRLPPGEPSDLYLISGPKQSWNQNRQEKANDDSLLQLESSAVLREDRGFEINEVSSQRTTEKPLVVSEERENRNDEVRTDASTTEFTNNELTADEMPTPPEVNPLFLSRQLAKTMLQMDHSTRCGAVANGFINQYLSSEAAWSLTWKLVLHKVALKDDERALRLGIFMLNSTPRRNDIGGLLLFRHHLQEKDKTVLLGAVRLVEELASNITETGLVLSDMLPDLVRIVQSSQSKRTVLGQEALEASYRILAVDRIDRDIFRALLQVHQDWCHASMKRENLWRKHCTLAVLRDWVALVEVSPDELLQEEASGISLHESQDFGGICNTLIMTSAMEADQVVKTLSPTSITRTVFRGLMASMGHHKFVWKSDSSKLSIIAAQVLLLPPMLGSKEAGAAGSPVLALAYSLLLSLLQCVSADGLYEMTGLLVKYMQENSSEAAFLTWLVEPWRISLLTNKHVEDNRYMVTLESVCRVMFQNPDQTEPITIFGKLVDVKEDVDSERVARGIASVLELCCMQITQMTDSNDIYDRLAPLLLIRRIPSSLCLALFEITFPGTQEFESLLTSLVNHLAKRLDMNEKSQISPVERKLAAEIAANHVPFDNDLACSAFYGICSPAFRNLISAIKRSEQVNQDLYRSSTASLFIAGCHIRRTRKSGASFQAVSSFALWLLLRVPRINDQELLECQRGCIDFFASCFEASLSDASVQVTEITAFLELVTFEDSLILPGWLQNNIFNLHFDSRDFQLAPLKICAWNMLILVSQRLSGSLQHFWANRMAPNILNWLETNKDKRADAPLQVLFILVTTTKALDCIGNQRQRLIKVLRQKLESHDSATRLAALKVLLRIIVLDVDEFERLGQEAMATYETVARVAQLDKEGEFRELAQHLIG